MAGMPENLDLTQDKRRAMASGLLVTTLAMLALGVVMVHSALASLPASDVAWYKRVDMRHSLFASLAAIVLFLGGWMRFRWFGGRGKWPYCAIGLFILALGFMGLLKWSGLGEMRNGKVRWLKFGPAAYGIGFQPSEVLKLAMVLLLAAWLSGPSTQIRSFFKTFLPAVALMGLCFGIVFHQDLGTATMICMAALVTMFLAGIPWYYLISLLPIGAGWFWWAVSGNANRLARIEAMLDPWNLENPSTWQPRQSLQAILEGGWCGKGLGRGVNKLGFLPEDTTDFIFASYCSEWGFVGAVLLMLLIVLWIYFAVRASMLARDGFAKLFIGALGFLIAMQMVLHLAVNLVVLPPTGMSFPFISAGGTGLLIMASAAAIMVSMTRYGGQSPTLQETSHRVDSGRS